MRVLIRPATFVAGTPAEVFRLEAVAPAETAVAACSAVVAPQSSDSAQAVAGLVVRKRSVDHLPRAAERFSIVVLHSAEAHSAAGHLHWRAASRRCSVKGRSVDRLPRAAERFSAAVLRSAEAHSAAGRLHWTAARALLAARRELTTACLVPAQSGDYLKRAMEQRSAAGLRSVTAGSAARPRRVRGSPGAGFAVRRQPWVARA